MLRGYRVAASLLAAGLVLTMGTGCPDTAAFQGTEDFPRVPNNLLPEVSSAEGTRGSGMVTGEALAQPIAFPHYRHAVELGMQCQYCHQAARKSIHAGVPSSQTCMNCHAWVKPDNPEIAKIKGYFDSGEPIPWKKVHDLPDFVHFSHKRHVGAGVQCTECHGQIGLQGRPEKFMETVIEDGHEVQKEVVKVKDVMIRETTMQMGWCLDCHATHPSVDANYGDKATLRRAELKDCWTCHK